MPLEPPRIDGRGYAQLLAGALRRIPVHNPEWTGFNPSDPGVALLELLAFVADTLLSELDEQQRRRRRRRRLALLVVGTAGLAALWLTARPARTS